LLVWTRFGNFMKLQLQVRTSEARSGRGLCKSEFE
jgi:hypothetical protein